MDNLFPFIRKIIMIFCAFYSGKFSIIPIVKNQNTGIPNAELK